MLMLSGSIAYAAVGSGTEVAGTVPRLLIAVESQNSQSGECSLGDAVTDAVRRYLKSDVAIVCGGDLVNNLPAGDVTWDALRSVFAEDRHLATATVTIRQLREILEAGLSRVVMDESERIDAQASMHEGFPQISGFTLFFEVSAPPGERVYEVIMGNESLDLDDDTKTVVLAATSFMLEGGYGMPKVEPIARSELTLVDVMARYMNDGMGEYQNTGERIRSMGTANVLVSGLLVVCVIIGAVALSWLRKRLLPKRFF